MQMKMLRVKILKYIFFVIAFFFFFLRVCVRQKLIHTYLGTETWTSGGRAQNDEHVPIASVAM
jgi:hypothetical protein